MIVGANSRFCSTLLSTQTVQNVTSFTKLWYYFTAAQSLEKESFLSNMRFYHIPSIRSKSQSPSFWYLIWLCPSSALLVSPALLLSFLSTCALFPCQLLMEVTVLLLNKGNIKKLSPSKWHLHVKRWFWLLWFHGE